MKRSKGYRKKFIILSFLLCVLFVILPFVLIYVLTGFLYWQMIVLVILIPCGIAVSSIMPGWAPTTPGKLFSVFRNVDNAVSRRPADGTSAEEDSRITVTDVLIGILFSLLLLSFIGVHWWLTY